MAWEGYHSAWKGQTDGNEQDFDIGGGLADRAATGRREPLLNPVLFPDAPKTAATVSEYLWAPQLLKTDE